MNIKQLCIGIKIQNTNAQDSNVLNLFYPLTSNSIGALAIILIDSS